MAKKKIDGGLLKLTIDNPVIAQLRAFPDEVKAAIVKVVADTGKTLFERIQTDTPRDRGKAAAGWKKKETTTSTGAVVLIFNKVPYINVLEFGGYPVKPKWHARPKATSLGFLYGDALLGGYPPGPRTAPGLGFGEAPMLSNVSKQAPIGMVRQNLARIQPRFVFDLEEAIDEAFNSL